MEIDQAGHSGRALIALVHPHRPEAENPGGLRPPTGCGLLESSGGNRLCRERRRQTTLAWAIHLPSPTALDVYGVVANARWAAPPSWDQAELQ